MKLCIIGTGYVGLVTGTCFANLGNDVICVDKNQERIKCLQGGKIPFFEPGLKELVSLNKKAGRLKFSLDLASSVQCSEVIFIAVSTPAKETGEADISAVVAVAGGIAKALKKPGTATGRGKHYKIIVNKSTVPVGMGDVVTNILREDGVPDEQFTVVSNPEFLKEGSAIADFMRPDRIVIGATHNRGFNVLTELYRPLNAHIIFTSIKSAELIKYASNAFLANKISFINEIANICERVGSDVGEVAAAIGLDKRIGREFLNAGLGYGGSCLPKDVSALIHLARENGYEPEVLNSIEAVNDFQIEAFIGKITRHFKKLKGKRLAVLGLSFKPQTDDLRDAPSLKIIKELIAKGAIVRAYDPCIAGRTAIPGVKIDQDAYTAVKDADALILVTEWAEFRELDFERVKKIMQRPVIFDGRNMFDPAKMRELGFTYVGIGR